VGSIVGPIVAGILVAATDPGIALLVDATSYGVSAVLLMGVRKDSRAVNAPRTRFWAELRDGFAEVRFANMAVVRGPKLLRGQRRHRRLHRSRAVVVKRHLGGAGAWALILAAQGVGALVAGTGLLRLRPSRPLLVACLIGLLPAAETLLVAIPAPLALIAVAALFAGVGGMGFNTLWETTLQQHIPEAARSRSVPMTGSARSPCQLWAMP